MLAGLGLIASFVGILSMRLLKAISSAGALRYSTFIAAGLYLLGAWGLIRAESVANRVFLAVITEVVYIRTTDMTVRPVAAGVQDDALTMAQLASTLPAPPATPTAPAEPAAVQAEDGTTPQQTPTTTTPPLRSEITELAAARLDPIYGAFLRAKAINEVLAEGDLANSPSGVIRFLTVTDEAITLRKVWPRGLAVGIRGLALQVDTTTGDVLSAEPLTLSTTVTDH